tara:strand:- start:909 stop:1493 length:585 start_codon:yes stop_codon:yes gene_type:complete
MLGDLIWDYFDQNKIIKKSAEKWLYYYNSFNLGSKSTPEAFKKIIEDESMLHIGEMLSSYYLMAYIGKSQNNKQLSFQSVWQKESNFVEDIVIRNKDIRRVFNTEYKIIIEAITKMGTDSSKAKLVIDNMHEIIIKKQNEENNLNNEEKRKSNFESIASGLHSNLLFINQMLDAGMSKSLDDALESAIELHEWC